MIVPSSGKPRRRPPMRHDTATRMPRAVYEQELLRLQAELVKVQEWARASGSRVVMVFEGRDAAGKGGVIKRITQYLNPRVARIVALPRPTERERGQWYFQRYVEQLPALGELVLFDRSWYNRAGVEHVLGFCAPEEYRRFLHQCPIFERLLVEDGILLLKYWFSVSDEEQERRFQSRIDDPCVAGSSPRWTSSHVLAGSTSRGQRTRCSFTRTSPKRPGTWSKAMTNAARASIASLTSSRSSPTTT